MSTLVIVAVTLGQIHPTRNDTTMERSRLGLLLILSGTILFVISLFVTLLLFNLYLISLAGLFISVVLIAVGFAYTKNIEDSTEDSN